MLILGVKMIGLVYKPFPKMVRPRHFSHNLVNPFLPFFAQISTPKIRDVKKCCRFFTFFRIFRHFSSLIENSPKKHIFNRARKNPQNRQNPQNVSFSLALVFPLLLSCSCFFYAYKLFLYSHAFFPYHRSLGFRLSDAPPDRPFK